MQSLIDVKHKYVVLNVAKPNGKTMLKAVRHDEVESTIKELRKSGNVVTFDV